MLQSVLKALCQLPMGLKSWKQTRGEKTTWGHVPSTQNTGDICKAEQAHGEDLQSLIQTFLELVRTYLRGPWN